MPPRCSVCDHPQRPKIDRALATEGATLRGIARQYGLDDSSVDRHKKSGHVAEALAVYEAEQHPYRVDTAAIFHRNVQRLGKAQDAADRWLTDPENPERYELGPRSHEIRVIYFDHLDCNAQGEPRRKRATLQALLARAEGGSVTALSAESKFSDPRDYLLKSSEQLRGELTLFMQSLALVEERRARELVEQRTHEAEALNVREMFEARLGDGTLADILAEQFREKRGADEETARTLADEVADGALAAIIAAFQDAEG